MVSNHDLLKPSTNNNTVIWFVIIKKGKFVESILIGYDVLVITNQNDLYT